MRTIKLTLSYDGTDYAGWQTQRGPRTVQKTLEDVVAEITGANAHILASGRTDAGVHALGQVASFKTESQLSAEVLFRAINAKLPRDIAVHRVEEVHNGFHVIRDAIRKRYRYVLFDGDVRDVFQLRYCWQVVSGRLNVEAMQRAAKSLIGTHDFSSYETSGAPRTTSIRTVFDISVERGGVERSSADQSSADQSSADQSSADQSSADQSSAEKRGINRASVPQGRGERDGFVTIEVEANGFLYNMVRNIVGTLFEVGRGVESEGWPTEVLAARDRCKAGRTAPPQGLYLLWVEYVQADPSQIEGFQHKAIDSDEFLEIEDTAQAEG